MFSYIIFRSSKKEHNGKLSTLQAATELIIETMLSFAESIAGSRQKAEKFFPIVATVFLFVITANWIGILPGVGSIGVYETIEGKELFIPLFRSVNSDLNMTLAIALLIVTLTHIIGIASIGVGKHFGKFLNFKGPISFFVGLLEGVSEFAKILSFSFRLFGNVFAGEVLLTIITFLTPYLIPIPFLGLEIFVGFIQALIFSVLSLMFLSASTEAHH
jgi:F-type H+-transporting ATPase subunit a